MKSTISILLAVGCLCGIYIAHSLSPEITQQKMTPKMKKLTKEEQYVILKKGTEPAGTGKYDKFYEEGTYLCKQCGTPLFESNSKFKSGCGWPSFDDAIEGRVKELPDADGRRTEIICATCNGHLGHVFRGEEFTAKNTRHCVNSISLEFSPKKQYPVDGKYEKAIVASGCFWGTEYYMQRAKGVISTQVGYIGGHKDNPTYKEVCSGRTGHAEAVEIIYDPTKTSYEAILKLFFETHDPTQVNRQGPDIGEQYRSEVFYLSDMQREIAEKLVKQLEGKSLRVATQITKATTFWKGEEYHQDYYNNKGGTPYCHSYTKRF